MRRAYTFRLRPTAGQQVALGQCLASHRELYNAALQERRDAWRPGGIGVSYGDQSAQLQAIREARPDVAAWSFSSQQATLRRPNRAFAGLFRRVGAGQTPGSPRYNSAQRFHPTSDGQQVPNPHLGRVAAAKLSRPQPVLTRNQPGSNNRRRARATVANLVRRPAPRSDPDQPGRFLPNRAAVKAGLHRSIHDAGWAQFVSILPAKADEAGRLVIAVDARHTSDRCGACGHTAKENRADQQAARNILRAGLARLATTPAA